ncbi:MAG TPA: hypothetical protein VLC95_00235, partial [Anaerolineae bacterium]|nr:hypothetical protein [Anaerolineae bacterium]
MTGISILAFFSCVAVVVGGLLILPQVTDEAPAPAAASVTPTQVSDLYVSPLVAPTSLSVEPESAVSALAQSTAQAVAVATDSSMWVSPIEPTPAAVPVGAGVDAPGTGADAPLLLEPIDVPGPTESLQLVATSQLTLSSVIFVENSGQFATAARFAVRGAAGGSTWLADDALWIVLLDAATASNAGPPDGAGVESDLQAAQRGVMLKLTFPGSNPEVRAEPFKRLDTRVADLSEESASGG